MTRSLIVTLRIHVGGYRCLEGKCSFRLQVRNVYVEVLTRIGSQTAPKMFTTPKEGGKGTRSGPV